MKLWKFALIAVILVAVSGTASAIPVLQLYVEGGTYDAALETWVVISSSAKLWVMGNVAGPGEHGNISNVYLVASVYGTAGTLTISPTTTTLVPDPSTPAPPILTSSPTPPPVAVTEHAEYKNANLHFFYEIGDFTLRDSPVGDLIGSFPPTWYPNTGQLNVYDVTFSGYQMIHFDAYNTVIVGKRPRVVFAPFSHDASVIIPEPGALLLLGVGLAGIGLVRRRKRSA